MSTRRHPVEPDVDTDEAPVSEDVRRRPDTADSGSPSPDSIHLSSISCKAKEPTSTSVIVGWALQTEDRLVPTTSTDGARRAGRRQDGESMGGQVGGDGWRGRAGELVVAREGAHNIQHTGTRRTVGVISFIHAFNLCNKENRKYFFFQHQNEVEKNWLDLQKSSIQA